MRKGKKSSLFLRLAFSLCLIVLLPLQAFSLPGDADDPLVTKSWVDTYVEDKVSDLERRAASLMEEARQLLQRKVVLTLGSREAVINHRKHIMDVVPKVVEVEGGGVTLVPLRFIGEALDVYVEWNAADNSIRCSNDAISVLLYVGGSTAAVNGETLSLQAPAMAENGRTLVPLRFIGQAFNCNVHWDGATQTITITDK